MVELPPFHQNVLKDIKLACENGDVGPAHIAAASYIVESLGDLCPREIAHLRDDLRNGNRSLAIERIDGLIDSSVGEEDRCDECGEIPELDAVKTGGLSGSEYDRYECECGHATVVIPK